MQEKDICFHGSHLKPTAGSMSVHDRGTKHRTRRREADREQRAAAAETHTSLRPQHGSGRTQTRVSESRQEEHSRAGDRDAACLDPDKREEGL